MQRWTILKKRVEERFADAARGRVELRMTRFRRGVDEAGKAWISIDKNPVVVFDYCRATVTEHSLAHDIQEINQSGSGAGSDWYDEFRRACDAGRDLRRQQGLFTWFEFCEAMQSYLSMPIDDIICATNPMIRAIGFLDKRIGKRRLRDHELPTDELPMVTKMFQFRCDSEGITPRQQT